MGRTTSQWTIAAFIVLSFFGPAAYGQSSSVPTARQNQETDSDAPERRQTELSFRYEAFEECPSEQAFLSSFESRLEEPRLAPSKGQSTVRVLVDRNGELARASLTILLDGGEVLTRSIEAASCEEAVEALAFVAAVALNPASSAPLQIREEPEAGSEDPAIAVVAPDETTPNQKGADSPGELKAEASKEVPRGSSHEEQGRVLEPFAAVFVGPSFAVGPVPDLSMGGELAAILGFHGGGLWSPSARLGLSFFLPIVAQDSLGDARFQFLVSRLDLCPSEVLFGPFDLRPCGQTSFGAVLAEGRDTFEPDRTQRPWLSFGLNARLGVALGELWRISAGGGVEFPVIRDSYLLDEELVHETPQIAWSWSVGIELQYW